MDWPDKGVPRGTRLPDRTGGPCGRPTRQNNSDGVLVPHCLLGGLGFPHFVGDVVVHVLGDRQQLR